MCQFGRLKKKFRDTDTAAQLSIEVFLFVFRFFINIYISLYLKALSTWVCTSNVINSLWFQAPVSKSAVVEEEEEDDDDDGDDSKYRFDDVRLLYYRLCSCAFFFSLHVFTFSQILSDFSWRPFVCFIT
jgi:hypothetical protein